MTKILRGGTFAAIGLCAIMATGTSAQAQDFTIKTSGRVMIDYAIADADNADADWSASELRRLRLGVSGQYGSNVKYKAELNTNSSGDINAEDVWIEFAPGEGKVKIKAGQFKTPNSIDEQTSSRFISTLERSAFTDAFGLDRRVGVMASTSETHYTLSAGIFATNLENMGTEEGIAVAARATYAPILSDEMTVHLGASTRYRNQKDDGDIRYRQRPYTHIPGRIISTGSFADKDMFYGLEAGVISGGLFATGEYGITDASNASAGDDANFSGGYAEAGVFLGGRKTYKGGKFDRPVVDNPVTGGGYGAVAFTARYDTLDLADDAINGGNLDTVVLGIDWYPVKNARIGLNYFNADADLGVSTSGLDSEFAALVSAQAVTTEKVNGFVARLGFDF